MLKSTFVAALLVLGGCANQATLVAQDGKRYQMEINQMANKVFANIDGTLYSGLYAKGKSGGRNQGQAMLAAPNGDFINCDFIYTDFSAIGQCRGRNGREYTLTTD